ncbi:unnamed protein product [Alopecurus aequalis]
MHPVGYNARPSTAPSGAYSNSGGGFRNGNTNAPPYRQRPQQQQMTPQQREEVLMAAGRLAAEYLVSKGELPPHVLRNRPPAPSPFQERRPVQHDQTFPRPFQQDRPLAKQHFQYRPPAPPRQFQQRPFAPRPFQGQGRPIAKRPRPSFQGRPPALHPGRFQGRPPFHSGARGPVPSDVGQPGLNGAPAGDGDGCQLPVAQSGDTAQTQIPQMDQPNQG